jgi:crossover junction endodeoxyribonuclease RuvC
MIILAIDPGLYFTGYAVLKKDGSQVSLLAADVIKVKSNLTIPQKLKFLYDTINDMVCDYSVTDLAFETPFLGKNAATFTKLGYIRGILYLLSEVHLLARHEFAPQEIKKVITGYGNADKEAVARIMRKLFPRLIDSRRLDVTDATAIGMCAIYLL